MTNGRFTAYCFPPPRLQQLEHLTQTLLHEKKRKSLGTTKHTLRAVIVKAFMSNGMPQRAPLSTRADVQATGIGGLAVSFLQKLPCSLANLLEWGLLTLQQNGNQCNDCKRLMAAVTIIGLSA